MLVALLSDTHDNVASTQAALKMLALHSPAVYLHAGDLVAEEMLEHFAELPLHLVFGNNEWDHAAIKSRAKSLGLFCHGHMAEIELGGKRFAVVHGHEQRQLSTAIHSGKYDYVIHGHTHQRRDERIGNTRVINPGAIHRARPRSVAILEVVSDVLEFFDVTI